MIFFLTSVCSGLGPWCPVSGGEFTGPSQLCRACVSHLDGTEAISVNKKGQLPSQQVNQIPKVIFFSPRKQKVNSKCSWSSMNQMK